MGSVWGKRLRVSLFGESHGKGIGVVLDGLPPGERIDVDELRAYTARRAPGRVPWSTKRVEHDVPEILSGYYQGKTTGTPLAAVIRNTDTRSADYSDLRALPRPGHADLTGLMRYKDANDPRGGGHFSGRVTAALTFAGALADQILKRRDIMIAAHIHSIADIRDADVNPADPDRKALRAVRDKLFPVLDDMRGERMALAVEAARMETDSVGGVVECLAWGFPAGVGDPMFDGIEPHMASLIFGIPSVKGVEFGAGFAAAGNRGSQNNDSPRFTGEPPHRSIRMETNNSGGIDGGISNGMPIVVRVGFKPTASISQRQDTVNLETMENDTLIIRGRHDPCIVPRAVPVVEGAVALSLLDQMLLNNMI
ncbi:MAG: chorismate synthase [Fastidiosipilaceae bacterium]|jgi:chorismate synthase